MNPGAEVIWPLLPIICPPQDACGGPNYFDLDDDAVYEIHVDNDRQFATSLTHPTLPELLEILFGDTDGPWCPPCWPASALSVWCG
ncbi:DUF4331 domain-containing protein [Marinobacter sp. F4206]|uniref:DUF4331 domain-containing protein n=1 Tax=Marinobacter sp. F4206 TaxID=2861777 RepID=UPI002150AF20|nr:DUF4331 domain-containing protein [Marinobacter sp. F4206]